MERRALTTLTEEKFKDTLSKKLVEELNKLIDFETLGLSEVEVYEVASTIIDRLYLEEVNEELISKIVNAHLKEVKLVVTSYILENKSNLSNEQLDYVVYEGGEVLLKYISKVYRECVRLGRRDLIGTLRTAWSSSPNKMLISCPKCGFTSITPQFECIVCGEVLTEEEVLKAIDAVQLILESVEVKGKKWLSKLLEKREFYYSEEGVTVKRPSTSKPYYKIRLTGEAVRKLLEELERKDERG